MNRRLMQVGAVLMLLALLTGLAVPAFVNPRLALAAHVVGLLGGLVLVVLGGFWTAFALGPRAAAVMMWAWIYAAYANWGGSLLGAVSGASRHTPIAGAGTTGSAVAEAVVAFLLVSLAVAAIVGTGLAIWGLRGNTEHVDSRHPGDATEPAFRAVRAGDHASGLGPRSQEPAPR